MVYYSFNQFLKNKYGEKVWKIPIDAGFSCPNRDGTKGRGGCTYCNVSSFSKISSDDIKKQIEQKIEILEKRKIKKFIIYFQSYSNTHAPLSTIKEKIESALFDERVVAVYIGTRPDCIDEEKLKYFANLNRKIDVVMEYGLQSIHNSTLSFINRQSTFEEFDSAVKMTKKYNIPICAHIIMGLPGETEKMMLETVKYLSKIEIDFIKFHHLHIVKNTKMEKQFREGKIKLLDENIYLEIVGKSISMLPPKTVIARVIGDAPKEILIAPNWPENKTWFINRLQKWMKDNNLYQGKFYK